MPQQLSRHHQLLNHLPGYDSFMVSYYFVTMHIFLDKFGQEFELNKVYFCWTFSNCGNMRKLRKNLLFFLQRYQWP